MDEQTQYELYAAAASAQLSLRQLLAHPSLQLSQREYDEHEAVMVRLSRIVRTVETAAIEAA